MGIRHRAISNSGNYWARAGGEAHASILVRSRLSREPRRTRLRSAVAGGFLDPNPRNSRYATTPESCPVLWTQISRPPRIFMHHPRIRRPPMSPPCALLPLWLPYQPRATESPTRFRRSRAQLRARNGDLACIFCAACLTMVTWLRSVRSVAGREGFVSRPAPPSAPIARTWIPVPQRAPTHLPTAIGPFPASCCGARCS